MSIHTVKSVCEYCKGWCRVLAHVENNHLTGAEEDPEDPRNNGIYPATRSCTKLRAAVEMMYHPMRVKSPLKRAGKKGEGKWQTITWEQAFDEIAGKIQQLKDKYGAESIAGVKGTMRTRNFMPRFFNLLGSPNCTTQGKICSGPLGVVSNTMFGWYAGRETYGGVLPKCMLITGTDPIESWPRTAAIIHNSKKAGGKLIVVDPRETWATRQADIWLKIRPGTDTALFLSIINVLIEENLYDKEFVSNWCYGFDQLKKRVKSYTPENISKVTWIPAGQIHAAARMLGENKPHYSWNGMGTEQLIDSIYALQSRFIIAAITGSIDVPGGTHVGEPGKVRGISELSLMDKLSDEQKKKQIGAERFPFQSWPGFNMLMDLTLSKLGALPPSEQTMAASPHQPSLYRAMITGKPYPVKGLIVLAHNPMVTQANTKLVYQALKSLDLSVVMDYWLTPSAELADYVLPAACGWERPFFNFAYAAGQAVPYEIPGEYSHRIDYDMFRELGIRLGQEKYWQWKNLEEVYDFQLELIGMNFKKLIDQGGYLPKHPEFKTYEKRGFFATTTGKAELASTILERLGFDPLPKFEEPPESPVSQPELAKDYPYILITGARFRPMFHSEWRQIDSIREKRPHPLVQMNPETGKKLGINDGDWAWIETPRGRIRQKCQYFESLDPRVINCEHGWWFPELPGEEPWLHGVWESNANVLTDDEPDHCGRIHGGWPLRTALCKVYKLKGY